MHDYKTTVVLIKTVHFTNMAHLAGNNNTDVCDNEHIETSHMLCTLGSEENS